MALVHGSRLLADEDGILGYDGKLGHGRVAPSPANLALTSSDSAPIPGHDQQHVEHAERGGWDDDEVESL